MGKLSKLISSPAQLVRDSRLYRRAFGLDGGSDPGASASPASAPSGAGPDPPPTPRKPRKDAASGGPPKEKPHPLPTSNLSKETRLSEEDLAKIAAERDFLRFRASDEVRKRVVERIAERIRGFLLVAGLPDRDCVRDVEDFFRSYQKNPAAGAARTTAEGSLLWLFSLARAIDPKVIVESGVFKGASLFTLRSAVPDATLYGYEPDLTNLVVRDGTIRLFAGDWSESPPRPEGPDDLCYFDDHISNCLRVRQAYDLGFRHLIFDDSPDIGQLHRWRYPGVPTIQMVLNRTLEPGDWVEWIWRNRKHRYVLRERDVHAVRDVVEAVHELPSLDGLTGRATGVQTYVRLQRR